MNRHDGRTRVHTYWLLLSLAILLWCAPAFSAGRTYYACTLQQVLSHGESLGLLLGVENGKVCEYGLQVDGQPYTVCEMKEQNLQVDGARLHGSMQVQVGDALEKIGLDVVLDKGGTYRIAYGRSQATGNVIVEAPRDKDSKRWTLRLDRAFGANTRLDLPFDVDRAAKTLTALPASARGYNRAEHPVDAAKLTFDGTHLAGQIGITIMPDGWVPADKQPVAGSINLQASLDSKGQVGSYTAVFGVEKQRQGQVAVRPSTVAELHALTAPVISLQTPWRAYLVMGDGVYREDGQLQVHAQRGKPALFDPANVDPANYRMSPLPSQDWIKANFDDTCWPRYQGDLADFLGDWGTEVSSPDRALWPARVCLRSSFGVSDPAKATDLKVKIVCLGGAVVYVNGQEIGRGYLPAGELHAFTPADDYPKEAYTTDDGETALPGLNATTVPDPKWLSRYDQRIRTITLDVPSRVLVKGRNVIAIALHRSAIAGPLARTGWSHVGFREVTLTSASGAGVIPYAEALKGTHVWSADALDEITETPAVNSLIRRSWFWAMLWGRGMPVKGVRQGDPFDPVLPVKLTMPRNGVGSGQTVLSDPDGLKDISATLDPLKGPAGATIPATAVQIRYAVQHEDLHYCDALMDRAPEGARTVPVWVIVQAPRNQVPGWYTSTLRLVANGRRFSVPLQVLVTGLTLPDAKDFSSTVGMTESPDTIAAQYKVPLWSDAHFKLLERSFALLGQVGNDAVHVPVLVSSVGAAGGKSSFRFDWAPLIRWVKTDEGLKPDFTVLEKYLDTYTKYCAPPRGLSIYIWGQSSAREIADAYEGRRIPSRENVQYAPPRVLVWDPKTGATEEYEAPPIGGEGSEAFWKPMLDGVRALVVKRGWSDRIIMLGLGGDIRPGEKTVQLLKQWAPYARWNYLSHFSGDPGPKDGKMIATGGAEIGMMEYPGGGWGLPQFEEAVMKPYDFLMLPTDRWIHQEYSPPLIFRTMKADMACIGRLGLDFWTARSGGPKSTSFFSHVESLTVPGPDGAVPTVRFQMLRENVQDYEIRTMMVKAYMNLPDAERAPYRQVLSELLQRRSLGSPFYLSQNELAYDWPGYVARLHQAAAELAGVKSDAKWDAPPAPTTTR